MKKNNKQTIVILILIIIIISESAAFYYFFKYKNNQGGGTSPKYKDIIIKDNIRGNAIDKVYGATVMVETYRGKTPIGTGSGFVYKKAGKKAYIMTNHHVIDGGTKVAIKFADQRVAVGKILGSDKFIDIAVIEVDASYAPEVAIISKNEDDIKIGDSVYVVGTPVGSAYYNSVSSGIISGLHRMVTLNVERQNDFIMRAIQTDASVNPGNSGGPLINNKGEVIGVISAKLVDQKIEGMGLAIKINDALKHVKTYEQNKPIERPYLGISLINLTEKDYYRETSTIEVNEKLNYGVVVVEVDKKSGGAAKSGLKKGDVIIKIGDEKVYNKAYLQYILFQHKKGDVIDITYDRKGKNVKTKASLTKRPN